MLTAKELIGQLQESINDNPKLADKPVCLNLVAGESHCFGAAYELNTELNTVELFGSREEYEIDEEDEDIDEEEEAETA